jgi:hypothetical protein
MAKLRIECDFCGRSFTVPPSMTGEKVSCECGSFIQVPDEGAGEVAEETAGSGASDLPEDGWFIHQDGQSVGPRSVEELRDLARRGELKPNQNVYNPQEGNWRAASSVTALSSEFPPPAVQAEAGGEADRRWYVRAGKQKYGPYTADRVREMVEKNQLRARSLIWNAELDDWVELRSIEPFSAIWAGEDAEKAPKKEEQETGPPPGGEGEPIPEEEKTRMQEGTKPERRGITQNIKGLFSSGKNKRSKGKDESRKAQIPSTVLTVEYVDDAEGMEAALGEIAQALETLQKTTKQVQGFTSRLARAVDQQNRRTNEAIESLRRRMDKLYRHVERIGMETQTSSPAVPPMPEEEPAEPSNEFGVPARYADDEAHQRAWQVARVMVGDLEAYHPEDVREGVTYGNLRDVLEEEIEEARQTYQERTPEGVRQEFDYFEMALEELVARKTEELEEEGS